MPQSRAKLPNITESEDLDRLIILALSTAEARLVASASPILIARGGGSLIFRMPTAAHGELALKVPAFDRLPPDRFSEAQAKLLREAVVLGAVASRYVPRLVECEVETGYLAREYIEGESLEAIKSKPSLNRDARLRLCSDVLRAAADLFAAFHNSPWGGHVIRDFKPRNLICTDDERRIVLVDVGGVRSESDIPSRRRGGHRIGTGAWCYWPPEQLLEKAGWLDRRVDYFALGSTLHTLVFGSTPFANRSPTDRLMQDYFRDHAAMAARLRQTADMPPALAAYVIACLSPDPAERPLAVADPTVAESGDRL